MRKKKIEQIETVDDIDTMDIKIPTEDKTEAPAAESNDAPYKVGDIVKLKYPKDIEGNYFPIYYSSYRIQHIEDGSYYVGVGNNITAIVDINNLQTI